MKKHLLLFLFSFIAMTSSAQTDHRMSAGERALLPVYMQGVRSAHPLPGLTFVTPPASRVRTIGEWEELQALVIGWKSYPSILREIVRAAKQETRVIIVYTSPDTQTSLINYLASSGVDTVNVTFLNNPVNTIWSRDYGPWSAYTNDVDTLITIDWIYNRPRPADDAVPGAIASYINSPLYQTTTAPYDLVHTGGNFMTDGFGTGFSSDLVLDENSLAGGFNVNHTATEVDSIMSQFMGITRYIRMPTLPYDVIHHIDMHMKLLDEETILFGEYPTGIADGSQIEANLLYVLNNYTSVFGTPYKIVRIPMPDDNNLWPNNGGDYLTYTNSSFINKTIIVPVYGVPEDSVAVNFYRSQMPGYTVTPINCASIIGSLGALHCITKEIGTADPLLISHQALGNTTDTITDYTVGAFIKHRSGINTATVYWTTDTTQGWNSYPMLPGALPDKFFGGIPAQSAGTTVYYYIEATANSGKSQVRPMPAPQGWWKFEVTGTVGLTNAAPAEIKPVFPNPCNAITCVPLTITQPGNYKVVLTDALGKEITCLYNGYLAAGEKNLFFQASGMANGFYTIRINGTASTSKIVVQH